MGLTLEDLQHNLQERCGLDPKQPVVVGVSGGPDSLCLAHGLWRLGQKVIIAHLDHQLRPESGQEAETVDRLASALGVAFSLGKEDVQGFARQASLSVEEAARTLRYKFLFAEAEKWGAQAVAVAHTADDQVETVVMHLLRGSGLAGLRGMSFSSRPNPWSEKIALVRPLLSAWRVEVEAYIAANHLEPVQDPSNQDERYYRNYLRRQVIPFLEQGSPHLRRRLWQMADILHEDYAVLESLVWQAWQTCCLRAGEGFVVFEAEAFQRQPVGIQRGLARRALGLIRPGLRDIDFSAVQAVLDFGRSPTRTRQRDLAVGLRVFLEPPGLWLAAWEADLPPGVGSGGSWPQVAPDSLLTWEVPGRTELPNAWQLQAEVFEIAEIDAEAVKINQDPYVAWCDYQRLHIPLEVRSRQPGDRFQPLGMETGSVKLADFMINVKLPRRARGGWPVICSGEQICWLPGFRSANPFRLSSTTTQAVRLVLQRI